MALDILNVKKDELNGLLSKIQIGGKTYELKDLIARENIQTLDGLIAALSAKVDVLEKSGYDDTEVRGLITALQEAAQSLEANKADKEQVAKDISAAVAAEAEIARAAEKKNADDITAINAVLNTIDSEDSITSLKELAIWVEEHGGEAEEMTKAITKNAEDIAAMDEAYKAADAGLNTRIETLEGKFSGDESVDALIEAAKEAAIEAANDYTDGEIDKLGDLAAKNEADLDLKALAHKDSATGTVAGETISGVKATGKTAGSITVELEQSEHAMNSTGKYTPAGNVAGTVAVPQHNVPVAVTLNDAQAVVGTGTGTANAEVSYVAPAKEVVVSATTGTAAQFTEGKFTAASLDHSEVTANYVDAAIVGSVADECLTFTDVATKALSASKVNSFNGGSKESDTFVANTPASFETGNVIGSITEISATVAYEKVTGVTYKKAEEAASGTCAGGTYDISASFTGTEGDVSVAGKCHDYAVKTAAFNGADVELAVGDITVAAKEVTVR